MKTSQKNLRKSLWKNPLLLEIMFSVGLMIKITLILVRLS